MALCTRCQRSLGLHDGSPTCEHASFLQRALTAWDQRFEWHFADRMLTAQEETDLRALQQQLDHDLAPLMPQALSRETTQRDQLRAPVVLLGNTMLPRGAVCHFASGAALYQETYQRAYEQRRSLRCSLARRQRRTSLARGAVGADGGDSLRRARHVLDH